MYRRFKELGIPVSLTRNDDITLSPSNRVKKVKSFYGTGKDVIVISNHLNAGGGSGAEIIYSLRNNNKLSNIISNNLESIGLNVRKYYQQRLPSNPKKDYYFMLRDTDNDESIIIEYGFVDNSGDVNKIKNNYEKYAEAIVKSICEYKNIPYTTTSSKVENNNGYITYKVVKGDNLYSIANKYGTSVSTLEKINNLSTTVLQIGQKLKIPSQEYIVKKGDTLWNIAKKYNTSVSKIQSLNNLSTTLIKVGQKIILPK